MSDKQESELNLECVVCDKFTGGPVLCSVCRAKAEFRAIGKACDRSREAKFTKGPWSFKPDIENSFDLGAIVAANDWTVANIMADCTSASEAEPTANAHLIAAAPELYETLSAILPSLVGLFRTRAEEVLAQAEGKD
jgi:hypothetical protein